MILKFMKYGKYIQFDIFAEKKKMWVAFPKATNILKTVGWLAQIGIVL